MAWNARITKEAVTQLAADKAAVTAVAGDILSSRTLLGVAGTFDLDALMVSAGFAAGKVSMTISSTTTVAPVFTALTLVDANFVWVAPNGTSFTGKAPAGANFTAGGVGTYRVYCTNWSAVTTFDCYDDNVTALNVAVATALTYLDCYTNALTTLDVSTNTLLTSLYCSSNALTSVVVNAILAALVAAAVNTGAASLDGQTPAAAPTGQGLTDLATLTTVAPGRAWTITTD